MTGNRIDSLDRCCPVWENTEDQSDKDAVWQGSGITITDNFTYPPHTPALQACSPSADVDAYHLTRYPGHQLPSQQAEKLTTPQKRKYQVTTMGDSPLKLRISWPGARPFALGGSGRNSSSWDSLAGEEPYSDESGPGPSSCAVPAWQHAAPAKQTAFRNDSVWKSGPSMLHPGDEVYEVAIRPFLSQPEERLFEIHQYLCRLGLDPIENSSRFGFKFIKREWQPLPFQTEAWKKISRVRKIEEEGGKPLCNDSQKPTPTPPRQHASRPLKRCCGMNSLRQASEEQSRSD